MATLTDLQTTAQLLVQAVNGLSQTYKQVQGLAGLPAISATTLVQAGAGRVCSVSVTTAGSATGLIYDSGLATSLVRPIYEIPNMVSDEPYVVNLPVNYGILVAPGTGQVVTVSYS